MGLWPSRAVRTTARVREDMQTRQAVPADPIAAAIAAATADRAERVSMTEALTVPAFVRALQLYRGVIGSFPLLEFPNGSPGEPIPNAFLEQPDPDATTGYVLATTAETLPDADNCTVTQTEPAAPRRYAHVVRAARSLPA